MIGAYAPTYRLRAYTLIVSTEQNEVQKCHTLKMSVIRFWMI